MPIYGLIGVAGLLAARLLPLRETLPRCMFLSWTGIPCPACGSTRVVEALAHGRPAEALAANPLATAAAAVLVLLATVALAARALGRPLPALRFGPRDKLAVRLTAALAFLLNWTYLIIRNS